MNISEIVSRASQIYQTKAPNNIPDELLNLEVPVESALYEIPPLFNPNFTPSSIELDCAKARRILWTDPDTMYDDATPRDIRELCYWIESTCDDSEQR